MNIVIEVTIILCIIIMALSLAGLIYRMIKGPSLHDRVVALDTFGIMLMGMIALIATMIGTVHYIVVILLVGILAFLSTLAFAKYLERGVIVHDDRDNYD